MIVQAGRSGLAVAPLENCGEKEVNYGPFHGEAEKITTLPLKAEIVEGSAGNIGNNLTELLLAPRNGTEWTEFQIVGPSCPLNGLFVTLSGNLLAEPRPQRTEAQVGGVRFEAAVKGYKIAPGTGAEKRVKLEYAGKAATLTGEAETELVSKEAFGAF
jgi:hypothetical protein